MKSIAITPKEFRRFVAKIEFTDTCWLWTGATTSRGYGSCQINGKIESAHAVMYAALWGDYDGSQTIDHLCCVKACVKPTHLELVSLQENVRRARQAGLVPTPVQAQRNSQKTHCKRGHEFDQANTYVDPKGHRYCRTCKRERKSA